MYLQVLLQEVIGDTEARVFRSHPELNRLYDCVSANAFLNTQHTDLRTCLASISSSSSLSFASSSSSASSSHVDSSSSFSPFSFSKDREYHMLPYYVIILTKKATVRRVGGAVCARFPRSRMDRHVLGTQLRLHDKVSKRMPVSRVFCCSIVRMSICVLAVMCLCS